MVKLLELLQYKNEHLLQRYQKDYPNNKLSSQEALTELLKYFWLTKKHQTDKQNNPHAEDLNFDCVMHAEMHEIDDMWHTFLLFTEDYVNFCQSYFGNFLHHVPNEKEEPKQSKDFATQLERYLLYIYDHLGEPTLKTWFAECIDHID